MENVHPKKKLDTKEDPNNNHTIEDQGQSWDFDPDWGPSFGKTCLIPRRMELRNQETKAIVKEMRRTNFGTCSSQKEPGHNREPTQQSYYWAPWNNVRVQCFDGVLMRHPIFWEMRHFEKSKRMELGN